MEHHIFPIQLQLWVPLYIMCRNATPWLRKHTLRPLEVLGEHSLELYLLQFNLFLARAARLNLVVTGWQTCDLAHSDFSEYNILWYDGEPWVIDVGQAVVSAHPSSNEFLVRDVTRLVQWINRQGFDVQLADALLRVLEEPVPTYPPLSGGD